ANKNLFFGVRLVPFGEKTPTGKSRTSNQAHRRHTSFSHYQIKKQAWFTEGAEHRINGQSVFAIALKKRSLNNNQFFASPRSYDYRSVKECSLEPDRLMPGRGRFYVVQIGNRNQSIFIQVTSPASPLHNNEKSNQYATLW
ncbi:MAG: hypothetical protein ACPGWR_12105, partial [Ardenticatenaceae bacterium]